MPGVAAFLTALLAGLGHPAAHAAAVARVAATAGGPRVQVVSRPRPSKLRSCSTTHSQPSGTGRKILPVACEQPPKSSVAGNAATGGVSSLFGH